MVGRLFQFMDFQSTDFGALYPEIVPGIGGVWFIRWDRFNPGQGQFNADPIRAWLAAERENLLADGTPKPLILMLMVHTAPKGTDVRGLDLTPEWLRRVAPTVTITVQVKQTKADGTVVYVDSPAVMPAYGNPFWWQCLGDAVKALGAAVDGEEQIAFVGIAHGCDGELQPHKGAWLGKLPAGVERMFGLKTVEIFDAYKASFLKTPVVARCLPGSGRGTFTREAIKRGIGIHMCGMLPGNQNAHGWGNEYPGAWDILVEAVKAGVTAIAESTTGNGNREHMYWSVLAMVSLGINAMDCHPEWFQRLEPDMWNWAAAHMGQTAATAPSAWCVLRDYDPQFKPVQWTGSNGVVSGQSDWPGNFEYHLQMQVGADAERVAEIGPEDALEYRQCRLVRDARFEIDPLFRPETTVFEVAIDWLQQDSRVLEVADGQTEQVIRSTGTGQWERATVRVTSRVFSVRSSGAAVHRLDVTAVPEAEEPPEPPEPPKPDYAIMLGTVDETQAMIDEAKMSLTDATTALQELRKMIAKEAAA